MSIRDLIAALRCTDGCYTPAAKAELPTSRKPSILGERYYTTPSQKQAVDAGVADAIRCASWQAAEFGAILGKIGTRTLWHDFNAAPHLLIAGESGSGKSVCIHSIITSLLFKHSPHQLRLVLIDPKRVELAQYSRLPHLLRPTAKTPDAAERALMEVVHEMHSRYRWMESSGLRNMGENASHIVIVFDEYATFMSDKRTRSKLEPLVCDIARLGRAANIHLVIATQYPTAAVINNQIKSNLNAAIAFRLPNRTQSRVVLDEGGAELLNGSGDGLYRTSCQNTQRFQGLYVPDEQIETLVDYWIAEGKTRRYA